MAKELAASAVQTKTKKKQSEQETPILSLGDYLAKDLDLDEVLEYSDFIAHMWDDDDDEQ